MWQVNVFRARITADVFDFNFKRDESYGVHFFWGQAEGGEFKKGGDVGEMGKKGASFTGNSSLLSVMASIVSIVAVFGLF